MTLADVDAVTRVVGDRPGWRSRSPPARPCGPARRSRFTSVQGVLETTPQVFVRRLARGAYLTASDVDTAPPGRRARRRRWPAPCSATATRSASRSPSPACGSG